jgi:hypothetical protein
MFHRFLISPGGCLKIELARFCWGSNKKKSENFLAAYEPSFRAIAIQFTFLNFITLKKSFFSNTHNDNACIETYKPYTLAGFEPGIFCSGGGHYDHYATPPGPRNSIHLIWNRLYENLISAETLSD